MPEDKELGPIERMARQMLGMTVPKRDPADKKRNQEKGGENKDVTET